MTLTISTHQRLVDEAYSQWANQNWTYGEFIDSLGDRQRQAVLIANLNYQVETGGFAQWHFNSYSSRSNQLIAALEEIGTDAAIQAAQLVSRVVSQLDDADDEDYLEFSEDDLFYAINAQLLIDCEAWLNRP
jgi:hypothetical protein